MMVAAVFAVGLSASAAIAKQAVSEPPVIEQMDAQGRFYQTQTFAAGKVDARPGAVSMAVRHYVTRGQDGALPAFAVRAECEIGDDGAVQVHTCAALDPLDEAQKASFALLLRSGSLDGVPRYGVINRMAEGSVEVLDGRPLPFIRDRAGGLPGLTRTTPRYRLMQATLRVAAVPAIPAVDMSAGPLVPYAQLPAIKAALVEGRAGLGTDDYPAAALRDGVEGKLTLHCQVQADLSVACQMAAFDPVDKATYFNEFARGAMLRVKVDEKLADGTPAAGVRTRLPVRLMLPKD